MTDPDAPAPSRGRPQTEPTADPARTDGVFEEVEALVTVLAGLAHDFNNLMMILLTGLDTLEQEAAARYPAFLQALSDIKLAATSSAAVVRRLLASGRNDSEALEHFSAHRLVGETLPIIRQVLPSTVQVSTAVAEGAWLRGCRAELQQVLLNVIMNARDAMPSGGRLEIEGTVVELGRAAATAERLDEPGKYVQLVVRDTGVGMTEGALARAFEPFFSTKSPDRGAGLGLAIAHMIVRQHRGTIAATSQLGRGTAVRVLLPASERVLWTTAGAFEADA